MQNFLQYAVLGLGPAAVYTLLAQGIVLIHRGSGVINFAHGAFALCGAIAYTELQRSGVSPVIAILAAAAAGAAVGLLVQVGILRVLREAAAITRVIATIGVLLVVQAGAALHYSDTLTLVPQFLPAGALDIGGVRMGADRLILFGLGVLVTVALVVLQRRWVVLLATRASAENDEAIAGLGWSPNALAAVNWGIGGALAGLAGALIVPLTGLAVLNMILLVVPALAAALLARLDSFTLTLIGATTVGVTQSLITGYWSQPGAVDAVPFLFIIVILVVTGKALPLRSHIGERLPSVGNGIARPRVAVAVAVVGVVCMLLVFNEEWQSAFTVSIAMATLLLSIVVVTGFAGQISLAQATLAGIGAYIAGRLFATQGFPFWVAAPIGIALAVPIGALFALPALRTRGASLAVITLGLAAAVSAILFSNTEYTGGALGTPVGGADIFGLSIDGVLHPDRYGAFVVLAFCVALLVVFNVRRSVEGRRMLAIRENERAAASLGISVVRTKLYAFSVGSVIAALAGMLIAFQQQSIVFTTFGPLASILAMALTVIGGLGYLLGPLLGATLAPGGVGSLFDGLLHGVDTYLTLIGGIVLIVMVVVHPDGMVAAMVGQKNRMVQKLRRRSNAESDGAAGGEAERPGTEPAAVLTVPDVDVAPTSEGSGRRRVPPHELVVEGLGVRFGSVVALDSVDITVRPGEIVGLIGPNGAGKTTFIDAVTGFVHPATGTVRVDGEEITSRPIHRRVEAGLARSWQSLELFEAVSVLDNLHIASEWRSGGALGGATSTVRPKKAQLTEGAIAAIEEFRLEPYLASFPGDTPYGIRRLIGIARSIATEPSILLLDEPAAGLSASEAEELGVLLRRLSDEWGMGILLVEHNVELVMSTCDRVAVLDFGKKIADDIPSVVREDERVMAAYLGIDEMAEVTG